MDELAELFETHRARLRAVAYRMLGSSAEAEDAVQETWLRLSRVDADEVDNLAAWLRTVVSRVCLDVLRARRSRPEVPVGQVPDRPSDADPEQELLLAESVGRALLVVLDALAPAERVAFVLHDLFAVPFDEIAPIVGRTTVTAKKLASRARQRVRGTPRLPEAEVVGHRRVVEAFLAAARTGDLAGLLAVLAPDVVRVADPATVPPGTPVVVRGAHVVAEEAVVLAAKSRYASPALVDGAVGAVVAPFGRLVLALAIDVVDGRVARFEVIADPRRLARLEIAVPA
ncbi:sigma-70 family RNA polymerase sigma factor [Actinosynnema sp. NPDC047251]|uniref:RNA polymerase sigma-70 factor, ECF subfamily n=1 Tax=Saccharothrix espanaensis (strain ATCC 51144 / DSM 44229 / JCM 9112 / NBRC 15066 / NRRL 15764) TaxID=1179773 RepID=K0JYB6_SACES|nr:sigma-70 family RNA polymerase sigma factor [Saccharothrix espanaensis]CCH31111.1 RNA polymerase sigma-70 factor, ECF subfamily [Saccharothrix espanaensis DSM 44229]